MTLADRIEQRIKTIPVKGGAYMALYPETLRNVLSSGLIRKIAEEAAAEAEKQ